MNTKNAQEDKDAVLEAIDDATSPKLMSKREALEWLGELVDDIQSRAEALREELGDL